MVTPPFAAIDGSTFKLKTATTNNSTKSRWPRTRFRCGRESSVIASWVNNLLRYSRGACSTASLNCSLLVLVASRDGRHAAFGLRFRKSGSDFVEHRQVPVNVRFCVLHGNRPLFVPPIGLCQHSAIHHRKPVVPPQIHVDLGPVTVVLDLLWIEHQRTVHAGAGHIRLKANLADECS